MDQHAQNPKPWFRPKRYGFGATPVTWEGWALTLGYVALIVVGTVLILGGSDTEAPATWPVIVWVIALLVLTGAYSRIVRARTDGDWRWRWGGKG